MALIDNGDLIAVNEDTAQQIIESHKALLPSEDNLKLIDSRVELAIKTLIP